MMIFAFLNRLFCTADRRRFEREVASFELRITHFDPHRLDAR